MRAQVQPDGATCRSTAYVWIMAEAQRITTAGLSHSDEVWSREKRYIVSMSIRTVCFVLAVVFTIMDLLWLAWIFVPASVLLPYIAVVLANAGASPDPTWAQLYDVPRKALLPGPNDNTDDTTDAPPTGS